MSNTNYRLAHTMMRVLDLEKSIHFYCDILGMQVLRRTDYPGGRFTNAFVGYGPEIEFPALELTHNWDQEVHYDKGNGGDIFVLKLLMFIRLLKILSKVEPKSSVQLNQ